MATKQIAVERFSVVSAKPFDAVVAAVDAAIGHPNMSAFQKSMASANSQAGLGKIVGHAVGLSGLMELDGVHLSYDRMASYLASYGSAEALKVTRDLDSKVEALLRSSVA